MALVAGDFSVITKPIPIQAGLKEIVVKWTPSGTYTAGGEVLTKAIAAAAFGMSEVKQITCEDLVLADFSATRPVVFDHATSGTTLGKIHVFVAATGAEVAGGTNLNATSTNTCRMRIIGLG